MQKKSPRINAKIFCTYFSIFFSFTAFRTTSKSSCVRYPETSSDTDDSDRREIVLPIDSSIIDDYGDFDALEKLAELMQEKGLTQDDLLVVLNAVKLKNIEK